MEWKTQNCFIYLIEINVQSTINRNIKESVLIILHLDLSNIQKVFCYDLTIWHFACLLRNPIPACTYCKFFKYINVYMRKKERRREKKKLKKKKLGENRDREN